MRGSPPSAQLDARLTLQDSSPTAPFQPHATAPIPARIGRYLVKRLLGRGGFGLVFLAQDEHLERPVAIKVPHPERLSGPEQIDLYLREARLLARLDDPHIVPVYDIGTTPEQPLYIVSKYIDGADLASAASQRRFAVREAAGLIATLAGALHRAHGEGIVHRDIKPGNILIDCSGKPYLADFGLALREQDFGAELAYVGTPAYMSPEQARGEGHRVDGRSDVYSLGVVLYELLTRRRPFQAESTTELLSQIATLDVRPPRQIWDGIPKELERVCLRALARRALDRYTTAKDFADDLRHFLSEESHPVGAGAGARFLHGMENPLPNGPTASDPKIRVVPKGLRAFDSRDADFFVELLPGPRDRDGLPTSIRFWKSQIEQPETDASFRVGVIYGPSGCGKSSLVRAGLLPRLSSFVRPVIVVATPGETEQSLLSQLRSELPGLPAGESLARALKRLRIERELPGETRKVLIVLDQFEQWLHATDAAAQRELIAALRQCDGVRLQCLLIVRDDFWMSVSRLMHQLEIPIAEGRNSSAIDLFDLRHARRVLHAFGAAYGALPEGEENLSADQRQFLDQAVEGLTETDHVICVRLALFAQMLKDKQWTPATLRALGGAQGIGVRFLEETFNAATAPLEHRRLQGAARAVLQSLLPEHGSEIKGASRADADLAAASGLRTESDDFRQLIAILSDELRLLTPADPEDPAHPSSESDDGAASPTRTAEVPKNAARRYQLTHDYLVPALREWLTQKQRETRRGRAELRLAERTDLWNKSRERKQLPTLTETAGILLFTRQERWSASQRLMMRAARRVHSLRLAAFAAVAGVVATILLLLQYQAQEALHRSNAQALIDSLLVAEMERIPEILDLLDGHRNRWEPQLTRIARDRSAPPAERLRAGLALSRLTPEYVPDVIEWISRADPSTIRTVSGLLERHRALAASVAWQAAVRATEEGSESIPEATLPIAALLARYDPQNESWSRIARPVAAALIKSDQRTLDEWTGLLRPATPHLFSPLREWFTDSRKLMVDRLSAARILADAASPRTVCSLLVEADPAQFAVLLPAVAETRDIAVAALREGLRPVPPPSATLTERLDRARRVTNLVAALLSLGEPADFLRELEHLEDPTTRTRLVDSLRDFGVPAASLVQLLDEVNSPTVQQGLLLALGPYVAHGLPRKAELAILERARSAFHNSPHLAVRAAGEWLLKQAPSSPAPQQASAPAHGSDWYLNGQQQVLRIVRGPLSFSMGSPESEPWREHLEPLHIQEIPRSYAIGVTEVTVAEFLRFQKDFQYAMDVTSDPLCPVSSISWFDAVRYCRWLSEVEHMPEDQMCYPPLDEIGENMVLPDDLLSRTGYRLPTEAEWEYACRAGSVTRWASGEDQDRLNQYCWSILNCDERLQPVGRLKPNAFGMFDMHGNVCEWCHNPFSEYQYLLEAAQPGKSAGPALRSFRGGGYRSLARRCRSAQRFSYEPAIKASILGFRIARTMPEEHGR